MKSILQLLGVLTLAMSYSCSDVHLKDPVENRFYYKLYGSYYNEHVNRAIENENGGLYIAGYSKANETNRAYVSRTLPDGMVDWDEIFEGVEKSVAYNINTTAQSVYFSLSQEVTTDTSRIYLLRYDHSGNRQDSISTLVQADSIANIGVIIDGNDVTLVTHLLREDKSTKSKEGYIFIHDASGNELIAEDSVKFNQKVIGKIKIQYYKENQFFLAATVHEDGKKGKEGIRVLSVINNSVVWDKIFGETDMDESCEDFQILHETLVIAGNYEDVSGNKSIHMLFIDTEGTPIDKQSFKVLGVPDNISCASFTENNDGNYVFAGNYTVNITGDVVNEVFMFLECLPDGTVDKLVQIGTDDASNAGSNKAKTIIYKNEVNEYLFVGELNAYNNSDICVMNLDKDGQWIMP